MKPKLASTAKITRSTKGSGLSVNVKDIQGWISIYPAKIQTVKKAA